MVNVKESIVWGIYLYEFSLDLKQKKVPYQLTFERDLYFDRTNVILLNLFAVEDNQFFSPDVRKVVCESFVSFFEQNPDETVYFELDITYCRNLTKFYKFYRWSESFPDYNLDFEFTDIADVKYVKVYISKR